MIDIDNEWSPKESPEIRYTSTKHEDGSATICHLDRSHLLRSVTLPSEAVLEILKPLTAKPRGSRPANTDAVPAQT
jgi:hypothetical protein